MNSFLDEKLLAKNLEPCERFQWLKRFPLHRFIVMKGSVIYELYETWCCESTNTVDGSEIRRSPVDMAVYPHDLQRFHTSKRWLFGNGIFEPSNSITIMQKTNSCEWTPFFFVGTNFNLSEPALSVRRLRLRACRASDEWRTCFFFLRIVGRGAWNV